MGDRTRIEVLLAEGSNINLQDDWGNTVIHLSLEKGDVHLAEELLARGALYTLPMKDGELPIHIAARRGYTTLVKHFLQSDYGLEAHMRGGRTPLHLAAFEGRTEVVEVLLQHGADINCKTTHHETPLFIGVSVQDQAVVKLLVERGADVNMQTTEGFSALFKAALDSNKEAFFFLLEKGANIHLRAGDGRSLLHAAASKGFIQAVEVLLARGLDCNAQAVKGWTPLHEVCARGHPPTLKLLIEHGGDVNLIVEPRSEVVTTYITRHVLGLAYSDYSRYGDMKLRVGQSPLHVAAASASQDCLDTLLAHGADVCVFDLKGKSALFWSILNANLHMIHALLLANSSFMITSTDGSCAISPLVLDSPFLFVEDVQLLGRSINLAERLTQDVTSDIIILLTQHGMSPAKMIVEGRCLQTICISRVEYPIRVFRAILQSGHVTQQTLNHWRNALELVHSQGRLEVYNWLKAVVNEPISLSQLCCHRIRQSLLVFTKDRSIWKPAHQLPIPKPLIDKILMKNLQIQDFN